VEVFNRVGSGKQIFFNAIDNLGVSL